MSLSIPDDTPTGTPVARGRILRCYYCADPIDGTWGDVCLLCAIAPIPTCGQPLYRNGQRVATCAEPRGVEHDHDDRSDIRRDPRPGTTP